MAGSSRRVLVLCAVAVLAFAASACEIVPDPRWTDLMPGGPAATAASVERDVAYGSAQGCASGSDMPCGGSQELDVHRSSVPVTGARPVVVWVHGGGWSAGDKAELLPRNLMRQLDRGWDVVSVNYRLAPWHRFPAQLHDVKAAIRWVKTQAPERGWNPDRVVVAGHSAGGNLAALVATTAGVPGLEPAVDGPLAGVDSRVAGAVSVNGVLDIDDMAARHPFARLMAIGYVGGPGTPSAREATVRTHVDGTDAPLYLVQGKLDEYAPPKHAVDVCAAADPFGTRCVMDLVDTGPVLAQGHDSSDWLNQRALEAFIDGVGR